MHNYPKMKIVTKYVSNCLTFLILCSCNIDLSEHDSPPSVYYISANNLRITQISSTKIQLEWNSATGNYQGGTPSAYGSFPPKSNIVERSTSNNNFTAIATVRGDSTIFYDNGVDTSLTYRYRIISFFNDTLNRISDTLTIHFGPSYYLHQSISIQSRYDPYDLSPDETQIATRDSYSILRFVDLITGTEIKTISPVIANQLQFNSINYISAASGYYDSTIRNSKPMINIYRINDGSILRTFKKHKFISAFKMSSDEKMFVTCGQNPSIAIWSLQDSSFIDVNPDSIPVSRMDINPDGSLIAVTGNRSVYIVRSKDGVLLQRLSGISAGFLPIAFSPDGKLLAVSGYGEEVCWKVDDGTKIIDIVHPEIYSSTVNVVAVNNQHIITGDGEGTIRFWNLSNGKLFSVLKGHSAGILRLKLSNDGKYLFSLGSDKINIWSIVPKNNWYQDAVGS